MSTGVAIKPVNLSPNTLYSHAQFGFTCNLADNFNYHPLLDNVLFSENISVTLLAGKRYRLEYGLSVDLNFEMTGAGARKYFFGFMRNDGTGDQMLTDGPITHASIESFLDPTPNDQSVRILMPVYSTFDWTVAGADELLQIGVLSPFNTSVSVEGFQDPVGPGHICYLRATEL